LSIVLAGMQCVLPYYGNGKKQWIWHPAVITAHSAPEAFAARNGDGTDPYTAAWRPYYRALVESGSYVAGHPLEVPETGTTVRLKEGKRRVQDGPFADTKEQLAGFIILELPRLTRRSIGQRAARQPRQVLWRSGPLHLKPCGGSRDEGCGTAGHSSDD
jgi:hypothetical protein